MVVPADVEKNYVCPKCKGRLERREMFMVCEKCKLAYPILDKWVPDFLIKDAWELRKAQRAKFKHDLKL